MFEWANLKYESVELCPPPARNAPVPAITYDFQWLSTVLYTDYLSRFTLFGRTIVVTFADHTYGRGFLAIAVKQNGQVVRYVFNARLSQKFALAVVSYQVGAANGFFRFRVRTRFGTVAFLIVTRPWNHLMRVISGQTAGKPNELITIPHSPAWAVNIVFLVAQLAFCRWQRSMYVIPSEPQTLPLACAHKLKFVLINWLAEVSNGFRKFGILCYSMSV